LKLHSALKKRGLTPGNVEWFANAIETSAAKLPELHNQYESSKKLLEKEYQDLQYKVQNRQYQNQKLERHSHVINNRIIELTEAEALYSSSCEALQNEIEHLYNEKCQLGQFVSRFRNTNKKYLKIKSIAKEEANRLLSEQEPLLGSVLKAVIESLRMAPDRYAIIFNSKYDDNNSKNFCNCSTHSK
jgi:chromosome segregation ATPase